MYTVHAQTRCQQRGIKPEIVDMLLSYGCSKRHKWGDAFFMDRKVRTRAMNEIGRSKFHRISDRLNVYVVVADDGSIITVAKRIERLKF